ncbi:thymidylate synthase [Pseudomonas phage vB_PsaM_M1]|nr:thymidylate synthase [Pseudomonas phage vB_PsaM_M1]
MFDFNKVRAIGVTVPVVDDIPDSEGILSFAARVSNPQNQDNFETAGKLLQYCVKHKHYSVFETCNLVMEIETPRDIARQILRHRSFSFQEFSQRYAEAQKFVIRECRLQDDKNRQNSVSLDIENSQEHFDLMLEWNTRQQQMISFVKEHYSWAIENGIAKECARVSLPEGNTMSRMYMNGTVRSWLHFIEVRDDEGVAQKEVVDVARKAKVELLKHFPFLEEVIK